MGVVHCDIRPQNFALAEMPCGRPGIVLIDFEASATVGSPRLAAECRGDTYYASARLLLNPERMYYRSFPIFLPNAAFRSQAK